MEAVSFGGDIGDVAGRGVVVVIREDGDGGRGENDGVAGDCGDVAEGIPQGGLDEGVAIQIKVGVAVSGRKNDQLVVRNASVEEVGDE